ncbi:UNVERIFIED_CONTAM: hypothetical protein NCL1_53097 [Trichonephila clavipes]
MYFLLEYPINAYFFILTCKGRAHAALQYRRKPYREKVRKMKNESPQIRMRSMIKYAIYRVAESKIILMLEHFNISKDISNSSEVRILLNVDSLKENISLLIN